MWFNSNLISLTAIILILFNFLIISSKVINSRGSKLSKKFKSYYISLKEIEPTKYNTSKYASLVVSIYHHYHQNIQINTLRKH